MLRGTMLRRNLMWCAGFLLLSSCAQSPPQASYGTVKPAEDARRQQIVSSYMAHQAPTHPAAQDISYNAHYVPRFPPEAARARHYGVVTLMIFVDAKGEMGDIQVAQSSGYPELDASAVDAAKHWVFMPAAKNGIPQPGWVRTPVSFDRPLPPLPSTDGLRVGVATEADARALLGAPTGVMRYTSGAMQMIWGNRSAGTVILTFDTSGKLTEVSKSKPVSGS